MEWQPIESAPIETEILVMSDQYNHPIVAFCRWYADAAAMDFDREYSLDWVAVPDQNWNTTIKVTHWMPLPEPPK